MQTIQLTADGLGLALPGGGLFCSGLDASAQLIVARLRTLIGECLNDPGLGLNYREIDAGLIAARVKAVILGTTDGEGNALVSKWVPSFVGFTASNTLSIQGDVVIDGAVLAIVVNGP